MGKLFKASLGSVDFITSLCKSEESEKIKEAVNASSYGKDFVRAALSVDKKAISQLTAASVLLKVEC